MTLPTGPTGPAGPGSLEVGLVLVASIHATVDLERALIERGRSAIDAAAIVDDPLLGARVAVLDFGRDGVVAVAEPSTEGRLAATLARHGEGTAGRYMALPPGEPLAEFRRRAAAAGVALSRVAVGPFGRSVLVLGGPVTGPHLVVVERRPLPSEP